MTHDRRRQLIALLDQYPIEREAYLHEGRRAAPPREEFADRIEAIYDFKALAARSLHEAMPETTEIVKERNSDGLVELSTFNWSAQMSSVSGKYLYLSDINNHEIAMINRKQLSELIALLQKARAMMAGGA